MKMDDFITVVMMGIVLMYFIGTVGSLLVATLLG